MCLLLLCFMASNQTNTTIVFSSMYNISRFNISKFDTDLVLFMSAGEHHEHSLPLRDFHLVTSRVDAYYYLFFAATFCNAKVCQATLYIAPFIQLRTWTIDPQLGKAASIYRVTSNGCMLLDNIASFVLICEKRLEIRFEPLTSSWEFFCSFHDKSIWRLLIA